MRKEELFKELGINKKKYLKFLEIVTKQKVDDIVSVTIYFKEKKKIINFEVLKGNEILKIDCVDEIEEG